MVHRPNLVRAGEMEGPQEKNHVAVQEEVTKPRTVNPIFRCLSEVLFQTKKHEKVIRKILAAHLKQNWKLPTGYLPVDTSLPISAVKRFQMDKFLGQFLRTWLQVYLEEKLL